MRPLMLRFTPVPMLLLGASRLIERKHMVCVRFAPSPTGFLHLGSARTALFNWLYARHTQGKFILRIEDTDKLRSKKEFLDEILEDLKWMGLDWDGDPIYQSNRFDIYRQKAEKILSQGKAYKEGEAIIFKVEKGRSIEIDDIIHGRITFNTDEIKDQVMIKSDGSPAYNFCCVVDDIELYLEMVGATPRGPEIAEQLKWRVLERTDGDG